MTDLGEFFLRQKLARVDGGDWRKTTIYATRRLNASIVALGSACGRNFSEWREAQ